MKKQLTKHRVAYVLLFVGLAIFLTAFLGFWPNRELQRISILGLMVFYSIWGILLHIRAETISHKVALEYMTVSLLGGTVLLVLTL